MKKLIIVFIIFSGLFYAQNNPRPGIDYFPHTGFFDFVVNALSHPWDGTTSTSLISEYNSKGWYLDSLKDLGLTNLVTDGQYHLDNLQSLRHSFFLNDMGFQWKNKTWADPPVIFPPAEYLNSLGHDWLRYPLEFGGSIAGSISGEENFGFTTAGGSNTCYWGMQPNYQPPMDTTGGNTDDEINDITHYSRYAKVNSHDRGVMLWGVLPWTQLADPSLLYKMRIYLRMEDVPTNEEEIFTINISNWTGNTDDPQLELRRDYFRQIAAQTGPIGLTQVVMNTAITDTNDYVWFESDLFTLEKYKQLYFAILWPGNIDLNIDKIAIMTQKYDDVFESGSAATETFMNGIKAEILSEYGTNPGTTIQDFYFDEPFLLTARYRSRLQQKIKEAYSGINTMHLNGATGGVPEYFHRFDHEYARADLNQPVGNYILFNMYPFGETDGSDQATVQNKLNDLIRCSSFGTAHAQYEYNYAGLRTALKAANQFTQTQLMMYPCS